MGQILKIALVPATLLWGAFSYNYYKCDIKGFCGEEVAQSEGSKLPNTSPSQQVKNGDSNNQIADTYNQDTNNQEEAWAQKNIQAFEAKANQ